MLLTPDYQVIAKLRPLRLYINKPLTNMLFQNRLCSLCLFIVFLLTAAPTVWAQNIQETEAAKAAFNVLSEGGLVVRLPSKASTLKAMQQTIDEGGLSIRNRANLEERIASIQKETKRNNDWLVALFQEHYKIGPVYFMYDTSLVHLSEGVSAGIFLDENLAIDPAIKISSEDYLLLRVGAPDPVLYTVSEALIISDKENNAVALPFPGVSGLSTSRIFAFLISSERLEYLRYEEAVLRLCRRLGRFREMEME